MRQALAAMAPLSFVPPRRLWRQMAACALALAAGAAAAQSDPWTGVALPRGWSLAAVGDQVSASGLPMRLEAGIVAAGLPSAAQALRQAWGEPVQVQFAPQVALVSKKFAGFFVTAQLTAAGNGQATRVVLSSIRLDDLVNGSVPQPYARMPSRSDLLYDTESTDRGRKARHLSWTNDLSLASNRNHVVRDLEAQGYSLQSEETAPQEHPAGRLLLLSRPNGEATVVIRQDGGRTTVTLNLTSFTEHGR